MLYDILLSAFVISWIVPIEEGDREKERLSRNVINDIRNLLRRTIVVQTYLR